MGKQSFLKNAIRLPEFEWRISFFGAHIQSVRPNWQVPSEKHQAFELVYIIQGTENFIVEGESVTISKDDIIIIPPNFRHTILPIGPEGLQYFCAHFDIDDPEFMSYMIQYCDFSLSSDSDINKSLQPCIKELIDIVLNISQENLIEFSNKLRVQIILSNILIQLNEHLKQRKQINLSHADISSSSVKYAKEIAEKIKSNIFFKEWQNDTNLVNKNFSISKIMNEIGISNSYGTHVFKKIYGISPRHYWSNQILTEAKILLKEPDISIEDISKMLGYGNVSHFSRQFKRWTNMSPLTYRINELKLFDIS